MAILDSLTTSAEVAFSLRKILNAYAGSSIRVRRSSDNSEQDVGFSGVDLDTSSMETFTGANNGFVVTFYDQMDNYDATNSTQSAQPQIVASGSTLVDSNGKPEIRDSSSSNGLQTSAFSPTLSQPNTISAVISKDSDINSRNWFDGVNGSNRHILGSLSGPTDLTIFAGSVVSGATKSATFGPEYITALYNGASSEIYANGTLIKSYSSSIGTQACGGLTILGRYTVASTVDGAIQELIVFNADLTSVGTDQADLEADQDAYWVNPTAGVEITHTAGNITLSSVTHTIDTPEPANVIHSAGNITLSSVSHTIETPINVSHSVGSVTLNSLTHTVLTPALVTHSAGNITLSSVIHTVSVGDAIEITHTAGNITLSSVAHTIETPRNVDHTVGNVTLDSLTHTIETPRNIVHASGNVTLDTLTHTVVTPRNVTHSVGNVTLNSLTHSISVDNSVNVIASAGNTTLTSLVHTITAQAPTEITHTAGDITLDSLTHSILTPREITHSAGNVTMDSLTHVIATAQSVVVAHTVGNVTLNSLTHTIESSVFPGSPSWEVQKTLYDQLVADSVFMDLIGNKIYDEPPTNEGYPYVVIGDSIEIPDNDLSHNGYDVSALFYIYAKDEGLGYWKAKKIFVEMNRILNMKKFSMDNYNMIICRFDNMITDREKDKRVLTVRYQVLVDSDQLVTF